MRIRLMISLCLITAVLMLATGPCYAQGSMEQEILVLINKYRQKKRMAPLEMNKLISSESEQHSRNMATGKVAFGHTGFQERLRLLMRKLPGANAGAENVAYGARTAEDVVDMWINSSGHRKNILGNYNLTGIGVVKGKGNTYYTQIFIRQRQR